MITHFMKIKKQRKRKCFVEIVSLSSADERGRRQSTSIQHCDVSNTAVSNSILSSFNVND